MTYSPTPGVRLNTSQIAEGIFGLTGQQKPQQSLPILLVGMKQGQLPSRKSLKCLSPEEERIQHIQSLAELLRDNALDDQAKREWRRILWCVPVKFIHLEREDDLFFAAIAERRQYQKRAQHTLRNAAQVVQEIMT